MGISNFTSYEKTISLACGVTRFVHLGKSFSEINRILDKSNRPLLKSLTPGAYVGVAPAEDDGVDFEERMAEIHRELLSLHYIHHRQIFHTASLLPLQQ